MRNKYIIGNWKMNKNIEETKSLLNSFKEEFSKIQIPNKNKVVICPAFTSLNVTNDYVSGTQMMLGAQNVHFMNFGAYTGEISADMLKSLNVSFCIVGHSERRAYFFETNDIVNKKIQALIEKEIIPIICVGETLEEREHGIHLQIVEEMVTGALKGIEKGVAKNCIIAYEPVWAIGTGKTATDDEAEEMCEFIRGTIEKIYDDSVSKDIHILYGGSVNKDNATSLLKKPNIDGALIGGASLKLDFVNIAVNNY